jgi:hypothetical protein
MALIPDGERKHAPELLHALLTPLLIHMDNYFSISLGLKDVAFSLKESSQFLVVVNLSIEHDPDTSIFIGKRLVTGLEVDDGEPAKSEPHRPRNKKTFVVGPAMLDHVRHRLKQVGRNFVFGVKAKLPTYTAHKALASNN